jgi:hypothetical protein
MLPDDKLRIYDIMQSLVDAIAMTQEGVAAFEAWDAQLGVSAKARRLAAAKLRRRGATDLATTDTASCPTGSGRPRVAPGDLSPRRALHEAQAFVHQLLALAAQADGALRCAIHRAEYQEVSGEWEQADVIEEDDPQGEDEEANRGLRSWQRAREG